MILWIDAQLSPALATWLSSNFKVSAVSLRDLGLRDATDQEILLAARKEGVTVVTKDGDFVRMLEGFGPPPQVLWITCEDTSTANLKKVLKNTFPRGRKLLESGERLAYRMGGKEK
jgi:predicted nuclease of predicted toxin-antitoxin system